jgi:hypothetical protein
MKYNFAQKVFVKTIPRIDNSVAANTNKLSLNIQINKHKVNIDKNVFKKTDEDVINLKKAKSQFKHNHSKKIKEEILKAFIDSSIPRWNISFILIK